MGKKIEDDIKKGVSLKDTPLLNYLIINVLFIGLIKLIARYSLVIKRNNWEILKLFSSYVIIFKAELYPV
ncbi:MAG: hypothetical protein K6B17_05370, partial [Treponema sp.]|nr:hypothetical protein [Treponema sp.]